ncbi:hypothetical protein [Lactiplantibacillus paraplantarum]|uniref:hypothetical protein n=1 Tax=Lactiplantibacillus paraplantarum TaxID=60520 RepID=UPI0020739DEB|nr:hypothetical protein [Lactiplantibacillus paraplantarum]
MAESNATQVILTDDGLKIIKAQSTANNAAGGVDNLNDPNLISVIEKSQLKIQMDNFATIYAADKDIATSEGIDFTAYDAAYHAYLNYMTPLVADMTTYSPIVRATFNSMVTAVQAEQKRFNAATQAQYNQQINKAQTDISDGQTKYKALQSEAETMKSSVAGISDAADRAISSAGFASNMASAASQGANEASQAASSALASAMSAESNASSAVSTANSTASAFGPVSQKADSAFANAMSAQNVASSAVEQALSAASDSKDAKQIAGAVRQSYKTLTDGSTMTIAELQNGLAAKLTKTDLNGYATEDWSQNQIKLTADGINGTISSIKGTVDGHVTSINDLQADSRGFKAQFETVNGTLGKQTKDIGSLQASSKELSSNFSSLDSDNKTNKQHISELKQTSKEVSSTLETVQTQVQNSAVGTNLVMDSEQEFTGKAYGLHNYNLASITELTPGKTYTMSFSAKVDDKAVNCHQNVFVCVYNPSWGWAAAWAWASVPISTDYHRVTSTFTVPEGITDANCISAYLSHPVINGNSDPSSDNSDAAGTGYIKEFKLEKGSLATDWCPNPSDNATVTAVSKISQTVDDIKFDISKKIEHKDLDGYATEDWTQNKIKMTADGFNGNLSRVENTVKEHTTSINDFQADSKKFKAQFTTYKDTVDRHDRDISKIQADAKHLSSNFDSLDSDNKTNQHNISNLQQSAKEVSSTLETVQTQVQNSAVGTNLLTGTDKDISITSHATDDWPAWVNIDTGFSFEHGKTYTFSAEAKNSTDKVAEASIRVWESSTNMEVGIYAFPADGERHSVTITIPNDSHDYHLLLYAGHAGIVPGVDVTTTYHHPKIEKGNLATDWCPNPADNATVTAVSKISQTIDKIQGTVANKADKSQITQLADQITSVVGSADNKVLKQWFDDGKSGTWNSTSTEIVAGPDSNVQNLTGHSNYLKLFDRDNLEGGVGWFPVTPGEVYYFSGYMGSWGTTYPVNVGLNFITESGDASWISAAGFPANSRTPISAIAGSITVPAGVARAQTWVQIDGPAGTDLGFVAISGLRISKSASSSQITQLKDDIDFRVKKGDVVNQLNIDAGGALLQTVGDSTKIVFSSPNIIFDTNNPVQIPNANISEKLTGKTFEAGTITATTKIIGADIEAPLVHSPSGSFKLDGKTGDIVGASIHSANNSWGIDKDGNINGVNIVANTFNTNNGTFKVEQNGAITAKNMTLIGGTLKSPTMNAGTINSSTINGTTFNAGDIINNANNTSHFYPTTISSNGHIYTIQFNSSDAMQTDLSTGSLTTKYRAINSSSNQYEAYDTMLQANQIALFAGHTNGKDMSFTQSVTGGNQDGYVLISPLNGMTLHGDNQQITFNGTSADVTPKGIIITPYGNINPVGTQNIWYVGNGPTMKTASFGIDGAGANNIQFNRSLDIGNFNINTYHTITSSDNGPIHFNRANGKSVDIYAATVHYESLSKASLLSVKRDVQKADTAYWAQLVNSIDLATYQYKTDDNTSHLRLSSIVDDVNVTKQWQLPDVFISRDENGKLSGVDDSVLLNATLATVQEQQKEIDQLNGHNMELEARLNKLEAKLNG